MERNEILLYIILIVSLLSLWFSYKSYSKRMRRYKPKCRLLSEGYSSGYSYGGDENFAIRPTPPPCAGPDC